MPNVMPSYIDSNSPPHSFISSKLGTSSSLMFGYEEPGDESQSARNCPDAAKDPGTTLDDFRQGVNMLETIEPIARRVLGAAHPVASGIEDDLQKCRAALARASVAK